MIHPVLHSHLSKQKILLKKFLIFLKQVHQADVVEVVRDYATLLVLVDVKDALHVVEIVGHHVPINAPIHVVEIVVHVLVVAVDALDPVEAAALDVLQDVAVAVVIVLDVVQTVLMHAWDVLVVMDVEVDVAIGVLVIVVVDAVVDVTVAALEAVVVDVQLAQDVLVVQDVEVDVPHVRDVPLVAVDVKQLVVYYV